MWRLLALLFLMTGLASCSLGTEADRLKILFLAPDEAGQVHLFTYDLANESIRQLSRLETNVVDYAATPDGHAIALVTRPNEYRTHIGLLDADSGRFRSLLTCNQAHCSHPVWHPDGRRLTYERRKAGETTGIPHLWWLDTETGETKPVQMNDQRPSSSASFSPDGNWISYVVSPDEGIVAYNFENGRFLQLSSEMGTPAVWSPDGATVLVRDHYLAVAHGSNDEDHQEHAHDFTLGVALYARPVNGEERAVISGQGAYDDANPAWSPDGGWIAFGRKPPNVLAGRQLWLVRPDGTEAHALTDEPLVHHGPPHWSPNGRFLLFQRYDTNDPNAQAQIWRLDTTTNEMTKIAIGFQPAWLYGD